MSDKIVKEQSLLTRHYAFSVEDAVKFGVEEAILLQNLRFWIDKNSASEKHYFEGRNWTYNSIKSFQQLFPFWSEDQIRRIVNSLKEQEVIITGNFNKVAYDRTTWYALSDSVLFMSVDTKSDLGNSQDRNEEISEPIPDINTNDKPDEAAAVAAPSLDASELRNESELNNSTISSRNLSTTANPPVPLPPLIETIDKLKKTKLTQFELEFVFGLPDKLEKFGNLTPKQQEVLNRIVTEKLTKPRLNYLRILLQKLAWRKNSLSPDEYQFGKRLNEKLNKQFLLPTEEEQQHLVDILARHLTAA